MTLDSLINNPFSISKRKLKFIKKDFEFLNFISIERFIKLLSGFEAFKFYYFDELNKFNFDCLSDYFIFSENYNVISYLEDRPFYLEKKVLLKKKNKEKYLKNF